MTASNVSCNPRCPEHSRIERYTYRQDASRQSKFTVFQVGVIKAWVYLQTRSSHKGLEVHWAKIYLQVRISYTMLLSKDNQANYINPVKYLQLVSRVLGHY
jgi:hypothetical protein